MSNDVTNFAASLVEMAKAMERVPELEASLQIADDTIHNIQLQRIDLEVSLEASRRYAASLEQRCHDLEVSRDAAELRFLEADDVILTIKRAMRHVVDEVDGALKAVEPLPEPTPVAEPVSADDLLKSGEAHLVMHEGSVQSDPTAPSEPMNPNTVSSAIVETVEYAVQEPQGYNPSPFPDTTPSTVQSADEGMGKSEAPFANTSTPPNPAHPSPVTTSDVGSSQTEAADAKPIGPYVGRNYMSVPGFISRQDWLAGGGTNEGYDWRP